jgi:NAD(P)-dependent dehydrogenase (short-subunit alcohol dehydrogenase family)
LGIKVLAVEPGAFRTNAYSGLADEPLGESIVGYHPMLEKVRSAFVADDGNQPGDPDRGARAVLAAIDEATPPQRLVLGGAAFDAVTAKFEALLTEIRAHERVARSADFD